ncbi:MAG: putative PhoH-like protein [Prokaryotic dsDNA virus sp.]|jgi:phosphate starvation-inducible PhoH-like protein|nr:MAG: putative PhoH-like protein [Prokaryotic dsDNA virus sp.]|tara:strand:+ start:17246 stop:17932 length:687 start_codon:yes stop_codon:yes gene_type:complete
MARKKNPKFEQERQEKAQPIVAKTNSQKLYLAALQRKILIVGTGSAGTGKTFVAASHAANRLVKGEVDSVVLSRPYVAMGRSSGFFPGTVHEKLEPYLKPMLKVLSNKLGENDYNSRLRQGRIAIQPMEAIRGMSFEDCVLIIDEAQNTTKEEMKSIVTRIGENCQLILCGDPAQTDIKGENGLDFITRIIFKYNVHGADVVEFGPDDVVRSGITAQFVKIFDEIGGK